MEEPQLTLYEMSEQVKQENFNALLSQADAIKELTLIEPVEIKEIDFKKYFLPIFKKEVEFTDKNINTFINNIYILTNSYNRPIQVLTDDLKQKLFKLPPIALDIKDSELIKNINFVMLVNKYNEMSQSGNPFLAKRAIGDITNSVSEVLAPDEEIISSYNEDIKFMYKRYNISYLKDEDGNLKEVVPSSVNEEIEFDYDD